MHCFADKSIKLHLNDQYIAVAREGFVRPMTDSSTGLWLLKPVSEENPCQGFYLQAVGRSAYMTYASDGKAHALTLTNNLQEAAQVRPRPNWENGTFDLLLTGAITAAERALTLNVTFRGTSFEHEYPHNKDPIYQHCPLADSGLTFSVTITEETVRSALSVYGFHLDDADIRKLISKLPAWTYDYLTSINTTRPRRGTTGTVVGTVLGSIIGGVVGFLIGGPLGVGPGAIAGGAAGVAIGGSITPRDDSKVDSIVHKLAKDNPDAMRSYFDLTPAGGPYANNKAWEDIQKLTTFPMIGDPKLNLAGCVLPPSSGSQKFRTWLPASNKIVVYPTDDKLYPPLNNVYGGRKIYMQLFVVVKVQLSTGPMYQMRIHPKWYNTPGDPNRKVHSQLSDGSRMWALIQGAGTEHMAVYAAGELFLVADDGGSKAGTLLGVQPQTGHYFNRLDTFDAEVFSTASKALQALGYDVKSLKTGQDLTDEIYGWNF